MNLTKEEIGYIAGVLDVRGSLLMWKTSVENHKQPTLRITVVNRKENVLNFFHQKFGGSISIYDKNRVYWVLRGSKVIEILRLIKDEFKTERRIKQANLLINEYQRIFNTIGKKPNSRDVAKRNKLVEKFQKVK